MRTHKGKVRTSIHLMHKLKENLYAKSPLLIATSCTRRWKSLGKLNLMRTKRKSKRKLKYKSRKLSACTQTLDI